MRSVAPSLLLSFTLALATAAAQQPPDPAVQTFRTSTRLIQVTVVVQDGRNRPVAGLTGADFQVFEDGQEVPVAFFSMHAGGSGATTADVAALAEQGQFTNRIQSPDSGGVVAIVFDQLNTTALDQAYSRQHLLKYLRTIRPDDRVALYVLSTTGMRVLYDFTRDAESLIDALERLHNGESADAIAADQGLPPQMLEGLTAFSRGAIDAMEAHFAWLRGTTTLGGFEAIAKHLAGVPGRKNIVWISGGFPFTIGQGGPSGMLFSNLRPEAQRAARVLNDADLAVYPVDARGLVVQSADPSAPGRVPTLSEVMAPLDGLRLVADWTGGRAFAHSNDIGSAITRAVEDSRQTYVLGYYPANREWNGRFREIKVKVRRPGVRVRHREGYFAEPPAAPSPGLRRAGLSSAVRSPLEETAIPIDVTITPDGSRYALAVRLDPGALALRTSNGQWSGELDVAVAQLLQSREFVRDADQTIPLSVDAAERARMLDQGLRFSHTLDLRPDAQQVRVVVRDAITGTTGSVFIDAERIRKPRVPVTSALLR